MDEEHVWHDLCRMRERCRETMASSETVDISLYAEISDIEKVVRDLWQRLDVNTRKGHQTNTHECKTLARRWVDQVVIPLSVAWSLTMDADDEDDAADT